MTKLGSKEIIWLTDKHLAGEVMDKMGLCIYHSHLWVALKLQAAYFGGSTVESLLCNTSSLTNVWKVPINHNHSFSESFITAKPLSSGSRRAPMSGSVSTIADCDNDFELFSSWGRGLKGDALSKKLKVIVVTHYYHPPLSLTQKSQSWVSLFCKLHDIIHQIYLKAIKLF